MKPSISKELLDKFLAGNCTPAEEHTVLAWYNSFESEKDYLVTTPGEEDIQLREHIFQLVNDKIVPAEPEINHNRKLVVNILRAVAATVVIALGITYYNSQTVVKQSAEAIANEPNLTVISNNTRHILDQKLSDGSHVWLNPGAEIKFAANFKGNTRDVYMVGEAFFEVTKNPEKPFIVHSANIITKVWGTSFRVRDSKHINFADVTVVTGKVSVKPISKLVEHAKEVMIYPDEQAILSKQEKTFTTGNTANTQPLKMWKRVNLSFDNTPLPEVIGVLNGHFNSKIELSDEALKTYTINVDLTGLNLPEVMTILCKTLNISYKLDDDRLIVEQTNYEH